MDANKINEPLESNATSLHGMYTDFDAWIIRYNAYYTRSIRQSEDNENDNSENISRQERSIDNILTEDVFIADILLRQRHKTHSAKQPGVTCKENDGFMSFDHVLFSLMDKNGDRRILLRLVRSKL